MVWRHENRIEENPKGNENKVQSLTGRILERLEEIGFWQVLSDYGKKIEKRYREL